MHLLVFNLSCFSFISQNFQVTLKFYTCVYICVCVNVWTHVQAWGCVQRPERNISSLPRSLSILHFFLRSLTKPRAHPLHHAGWSASSRGLTLSASSEQGLQACTITRQVLYTGCGIQTQMLCWLCKHFTNYAHLSLNCVKDFNRAFTVSEDLCIQSVAAGSRSRCRCWRSHKAFSTPLTLFCLSLLSTFSVLHHPILCLPVEIMWSTEVPEKNVHCFSGRFRGKHPRADFDSSIWSNMLISEPITSGSGYTVRPHWVIRDRLHPQVAGRVSLD